MIKLSEDFADQTVNQGTKFQEFALRLGKYVVVGNNLSIGFGALFTISNIASGNSLMAAFTSSVMTMGIMSRSDARDVAAFSREYFRQKDAKASAAPAGP